MRDRFAVGMTAAAMASLLAAGATGITNAVADPEETGEMPVIRPVAAPDVAEVPEPQPTPTRGAEKRAAVAERYKVRAGDSLSSIAEERLGSEDKWPNLWGANIERVGKDPDLLRPGTELEIREGEAPQIKPSEGNGKHRAPYSPKAEAPTQYANNLDGWIREALSVMRAKGIPGSYNGIHRNIMRESGGNPRAVNNWDINAQNGTPSKGLLQTIDPTFRAYHVAGTSWDVFDPVANIAAACNYAASRYGSIDNVNGAY
ncbi:hypothetical protein CPT_Shady_040 [Streptomyces phage Shady]|uniref:LysM domain-containing protein n=1 Tax=Streptomyces phage Shady TaxID=2767585 RepID=A0A873WQ50_9CAUD|nr:hypothetical protein CPT_Shady_040 [Streptomyces phage Shady]